MRTEELRDELQAWADRVLAAYEGKDRAGADVFKMAFEAEQILTEAFRRGRKR